MKSEPSVMASAEIGQDSLLESQEALPNPSAIQRLTQFVRGVAGAAVAKGRGVAKALAVAGAAAGAASAPGCSPSAYSPSAIVAHTQIERGIAERQRKDAAFDQKLAAGVPVRDGNREILQAASQQAPGDLQERIEKLWHQWETADEGGRKDVLRDIERFNDGVARNSLRRFAFQFDKNGNPLEPPRRNFERFTIAFKENGELVRIPLEPQADLSQSQEEE